MSTPDDPLGAQERAEAGPTSGTRPRPGSSMRSAAIDAAREEVRLHGPAALSIRAVARRAGFPVTSLYRHFAGRADLLDALTAQSYDELGTAFAQADPPGSAADPTDRFRAVALALRSWASARPEEFALLYGADPHAQGLHNASVVASRARVIDLVSGIVEALLSTELPDDPETRPAQIQAVMMSGWSALIGFIALESRLSPTVGAPATLYAHHVDRVLVMITHPRS